VLESVIDSIIKAAQHPVVSLLSLAAGILGAIFAVIFFRRSRRYKELVFSMKSTSFVSDYETKIPGLVVLFNDAKIPCVTLTKVVIWNDGPKTITEGDIAKTDHLRFVVSDDCVILDATILKTTRESICFRRSADPATPNKVEIGFEFMDKGDGAILLVTHTERRLSNPVDLKGTIKNSKPIKYCESPRTRGHLNVLSDFATPLLLVPIVTVLLGAQSLRIVGIVGIALCILVFVLGGLLLYYFVKEAVWPDLSAPTLPATLKEYLEPI